MSGCLNLQEASKAEAKPKEEQVAVAAEDVNLEETRHQGQVALRRLYHESKRPLVVMYTSPGCGASCMMCRKSVAVLLRRLSRFSDLVAPI